MIFQQNWQPRKWVNSWKCTFYKCIIGWCIIHKKKYPCCKKSIKCQRVNAAGNQPAFHLSFASNMWEGRFNLEQKRGLQMESKVITQKSTQNGRESLCKFKRQHFIKFLKKLIHYCTRCWHLVSTVWGKQEYGHWPFRHP